MPIHKAQASWSGDLKSGKGRMALGSGAYEGPFSFKTRFEENQGTNPEELIGAAHAGCFSMAFSLILGEAGYTPDSIETKAEVHLDKQGEGFAITRINLTTRAKIPGIDDAEFSKLADAAKHGCPVSKALKGVAIQLDAKLEG